MLTNKDEVKSQFWLNATSSWAKSFSLREGPLLDIKDVQWSLLIQRKVKIYFVLFL